MSQFPASHRLQAAVASVAARQHGVITTSQLLACGLSSSAIRDWTRAGRLHRIHRGVYAVGHPGLSIEGEWMAGVLACGEGAVLGVNSAAMLWRMLEPRRGIVHVIVGTHAGRSKRLGLCVHRTALLPRGDVAERLDIPVTTPARTLADLRRYAPALYRKARRQAEYLKLPIGPRLDADGTRSGLESSFLAFCRRHGIRLPEVNVKVGPYTVDFLWRPERVVVETDSFHTHGGALAFEEDRERDLWLTASGYEVARMTDRRLRAEPAALAAALKAILARAAA